MFTQTQSPKLAAARAVSSAISAIFIGFVLVLIVGFLPVNEVHNTTHDTRHATGFPCH